MLALCAGCEKPILDKFLFNVLDRKWHASCVQCADCGSTLAEKCYSRDGKIYCKDDFFRRFGHKCSGCGDGISPNDMVRRARADVYHLKCFTCMLCRKQLSTGEQLYMLDENQFICKEDYLNRYDEKEHEKADDAFSDKASQLDDESRPSSPNYQSSLTRSRSSCISDKFCPIDTSWPTLTSICPTTGRPMKSPGILRNDPDSRLCLGAMPPLQLREPSPCRRAEGTHDALMAEQDEEANCSVYSPCSDRSSLGSVSNNNNDKEKDKENDSCKDGATEGGTATGTKRRGPRTTIKAKQLETLKSAFAATPKPTRHIREQLAQETGLNMRVIQVWFQNRRSKERRMKQLSAMGARRQFFRNPRRIRALRPGEDFGEDMLSQGSMGYFPDGCGDFYGTYPLSYGDYFPSHGPVDPAALGFIPPTSNGQRNIIDQVTAQLHESIFVGANGAGGPAGGAAPHDMIAPQSSPDSLHAESHHSYMGGIAPSMSSMRTGSIFGPHPGLGHHHAELQESW